MYKIAVVEDHAKIRNELSDLLVKNGYDVLVPCEFNNLLEIITDFQPHLILLDINLPGIDGFSLCTEIRRTSNLPIIFVTSRNSDLDELMSITLGGDDFITKPYNIAILLARITALLKRTYSQLQREGVIEHKGLKLHVLSSRIEFESNEMELTKNEFKILHFLIMNKGKIVTRTDLIEHLWDSEVFVDDNTLSVNVTRIRGRLESIGVKNYIVTKRGQGYIV